MCLKNAEQLLVLGVRCSRLRIEESKSTALISMMTQLEAFLPALHSMPNEASQPSGENRRVTIIIITINNKNSNNTTNNNNNDNFKEKQ